MSRTLWTDADGVPHTLDQRHLPFERREIALRSAVDCEQAIREMQVRGAPLIGAVAAWGLALAAAADPSDEALAAASQRLAAARPTAVNLRWALDRVRRRIEAAPAAQRAALARAEAQAICDEDVAVNLRIGTHGAELLRALERRTGEPSQAGTDHTAPSPTQDRSSTAALATAPETASLRLLTHCNAGSIATIEHGTALAPVYRLHAEGVPVHVWVDETRPRNQGALTAMELADQGIAHTFIVDNAGGWLMRQGLVDAVIVGCDRVAANGDVANKIGTYLKALAAHDNGIPFYVACPVSSIDPTIADGASIPVEERDAREVTHVTGIVDTPSTRPPTWVQARVLAPGSPAANPGFDVTPARLVTALITEHGVCEASPQAIAALLRTASTAASALASVQIRPPATPENDSAARQERS